MMRASMATDAIPVSDELRCCRNDGREWRCRFNAEPGHRLCSHHLRLDDKRKSLSHSNSKAVRTSATRKETRIATNGAVSEDPGVGDLKKDEEKREKVVKASSSLVVAALRGVAKKNQGIGMENLTPKGILLGLTKKMCLMEPFYIRQQTKVMVEIGVCKGKKGNFSEVYQFYGQTEDEAALAAIKFLQSVLFEISDINRAEMKKSHGELEEVKVASAEFSADGKEVYKLLDREEVLWMKCKGIIDSAIEEIEARQREFN